MTFTPEYIAAYRFHRLRGYDATAAHKRAHVDTAAGTQRYPSEGSSVGAPSDDGLRWVESARDVGLRFVGFVDTITENVGHNGWYTDSDGDGETYRGAVWQLPAKGGRARYVAGYRERSLDRSRAWQDAAYMSDVGAGRVDLSTVYECQPALWQDAARAADSIAEREAESAREYNEAWRDGSRFAQYVETIAEARKEALSLFGDIRRARRSGFVATSEGLAVETPICRALRRRVSELVETISDARAQRDKLRRDYEAMSAPANHWRRHLWDAFNDGRGLVEAGR